MKDCACLVSKISVDVDGITERSITATVSCMNDYVFAKFNRKLEVLREKLPLSGVLLIG